MKCLFTLAREAAIDAWFELRLDLGSELGSPTATVILLTVPTIAMFALVPRLLLVELALIAPETAHSFVARGSLRRRRFF